ncbi:hypothetical protein FLAG1_10278 [Fusarium langsethiae]|uniref:Uncharacterized protein n=1 Tax=Fusarium langsethiae TaxID=179993 RepID=A0A0M9EP00_FUSLA|nr:hypothetical protein FLAG1_10278 [Fusarium langsethiae]
MESASLLPSLSSELIYQIVDYSCPSTILALALTCSTIHHRFKPVLEQHRNAYNERRVTSDLSPETVLALLKDGPSTKIERWHIHLERCIRKGIDFWEFSGDDIEEVQQNLESGSDAYLKLLLIASCPRLQSIRFVKRPYDTWSGLLWIERGIKWSKSNDKWPLGFESLQNVAVEDEEEEEDFKFHEWYDFPTSKSSVEYLFLDSPYNLSWEFYHALGSAPKELDTLVIRARTSNLYNFEEVYTLVNTLSYENTPLKRLVVYNAKGLFSVAASALEQGDYDLFDYPYRAPKYWGNIWAHEALPPNMEAMYVWGPTGLCKNDEPSKALDFLLARIIESGAYYDLKVVYVENVESAHKRWESDPVIAGQKETAFQETLAAGRKAGVHVCTLMNNDDGGYWKNFPAKPDRFDLKTGPCAGKRPADWKLNLYTGE